MRGNFWHELKQKNRDVEKEKEYEYLSKNPFGKTVNSNGVTAAILRNSWQLLHIELLVKKIFFTFGPISQYPNNLFESCLQDNFTQF
jgi:hypothetical protein